MSVIIEWWAALTWSASLAITLGTALVLCVLIYALDQWIGRHE